MIYSTDHSKAVVPVLVLLFVALLLYEAICFKSCLVLFCFCFFFFFSVLYANRIFMYLCITSSISGFCPVLFCSCVFLVLLALQLPRLGRGELVLVLFVNLFDLRLFYC